MIGAMIGAAVIGGGASIIVGNKAANAQKYATDKALGVEKYIYDTTRADNAPSRAVGQSAMYKLADMYGVSRPANDSAGNVIEKSSMADFEKSPGYQFRMDEGMNALTSQYASMGKTVSGGALKGITDYAQGRASDEFGNYTNALRSLAGLEQTAGARDQVAGSNYATGASNALINGGNARASSYQNTGSSINQGINNALTAYMYNRSPVLNPQPTGALPANGASTYNFAASQGSI